MYLFNILNETLQHPNRDCNFINKQYKDEQVISTIWCNTCKKETITIDQTQPL